MVDPDRFAGAEILQSSFPDDGGGVSAPLQDALALYADQPAAFADVVHALSSSRLLVPVVAVLGEVEVDEAGLAHDKSSDMATVLVTGADGRQALLAFTGTEALHRWNPEARPVPVPAAVAAQSAVQENASALVVDIAGPTTFVLEENDLDAFAAGWTLARVGARTGWIRPEQ